MAEREQVSYDECVRVANGAARYPEKCTDSQVACYFRDMLLALARLVATDYDQDDAFDRQRDEERKLRGMLVA